MDFPNSVAPDFKSRHGAKRISNLVTVQNAHALWRHFLAQHNMRIVNTTPTDEQQPLQPENIHNANTESEAAMRGAGGATWTSHTA